MTATTKASDVTDVIDKNNKGTISFDFTPAIAYESRAMAVIDSVREFTIDSPEMLQLAAEELRGIMGVKKSLEEFRVTLVAPFNAGAKRGNDLCRGPSAVITEAESLMKGKILAYTTEQERLAEIARKAAETQAADERARLADIERAQREQAEQQQRDAEAAAQAANEAAESGDVEQALILQEQSNALQARAEQTSLVAESTALSSAVVTAMPAVSHTAKVSGISKRVTYAAQVDSLAELIKAVAEGKVPVEAIMVNDKFLNQQARAFAKPGQLYPGVRIIANSTLSARAA
jgi:hypothetical protein